MSEKYKANDDLPYFVTMTFQGWIDLFTREVYRELFVDALKGISRRYLVNQFEDLKDDID